jgi:hypothetical protein
LLKSVSDSLSWEAGSVLALGEVESVGVGVTKSEEDRMFRKETEREVERDLTGRPWEAAGVGVLKD